MQMKKVIYLILIIIQFSCSKEEHKEVNGGSYHELKIGHNIDFTLFSYNGRSPQNINIDSMAKLDKALYKIFGYNSFYTIDTIQIFENSNKIYLSKYKFFNQEDEWGKLFEMKFRNEISITMIALWLNITTLMT